MFGVTRRQLVVCSIAFAGVIAAVQTVASAAPHPAWDDKVDFKAGKKLGVEVWYNDFGWMVRMSAKEGTKRRFSGRVQVTNGKFIKVSPVNTDDKDKFRLSNDRDTITFDFENGGGEDGFNFQCNKGSGQVVFTINIEGKAQLDKILIGPKTNPSQSPFGVPAFPNKN